MTLASHYIRATQEATLTDFGIVEPDGSTNHFMMECSSAAAGAQQINSSCTEINVRSKASIHNKPTAGTSISFAMNTGTNKIIGSPSQNIIGFDSTYTNQL